MAVVTNRRRHHSLTVELPPPPLLLRPPPPPPASFPDFEKLSVLGHGSGGTVYKVLHRSSSSLFALKFPHPHHQQQRQLSREISALRRAPSSPFVIRCHSVLPSPPALLLDYMDAGSLHSLLLRHRRLPEPALREITRQLLLGLSYLHSRNVVHRDLKPSNILLNLRGEIKICDFGVSRVMSRSLDPCDSYVGTCAYMSPERFDPESYGAQYDGYAADVWSLGLTVMELFLGRFPLLEEGQRPDWATLMCAICFDDPPSLAVDSGASEELRGFVECCVDREPGKRSTVEELLVHPFVAGGEVDSQARQAFLELLRVASEDGGELGSIDQGCGD